MSELCDDYTHLTLMLSIENIILKSDRIALNSLKEIKSKYLLKCYPSTINLIWYMECGYLWEYLYANIFEIQINCRNETVFPICIHVIC